MPISDGITYKDGAYWLTQEFGPYAVNSTGGYRIPPVGAQGPDIEYFYKDGNWWGIDGSGPYVKDESGLFFLRS